MIYNIAIAALGLTAGASPYTSAVARANHPWMSSVARNPNIEKLQGELHARTLLKRRPCSALEVRTGA